MNYNVNLLNREACRQSTFAPSDTLDPSASIPLFPSASASCLAAARDFALAGHRQRIGSSVLARRAGTEHRHRRIQVCKIFLFVFLLLTLFAFFCCAKNVILGFFLRSYLRRAINFSTLLTINRRMVRCGVLLTAAINIVKETIYAFNPTMYTLSN